MAPRQRTAAFVRRVGGLLWCLLGLVDCRIRSTRLAVRGIRGIAQRRLRRWLARSSRCLRSRWLLRRRRGLLRWLCRWRGLRQRWRCGRCLRCRLRCGRWRRLSRRRPAFGAHVATKWSAIPVETRLPNRKIIERVCFGRPIAVRRRLFPCRRCCRRANGIAGAQGHRQRHNAPHDGDGLSAWLGVYRL